MELLTSKPEMVPYMSNFAAFTADLKIQLLMTSAATTYGMFQISWFYGPHDIHHDPFSFDTKRTLRGFSTAETYLLDVASCEGCEFVIPYRFPRDYLEFPVEKGYVTIIVANLGSYSASGGDATPKLDMWANLENVKTHLMVQGDIVNEQGDRMVMAPRAQVAAVGLAGTLVATTMITDAFTNTLRSMTGAMTSFNTAADGVSQVGANIRDAMPDMPVMPSMPSMPSMPAMFSQETPGGHAPVKQSVWGDIAGSQYTGSTNFLDITCPTSCVELPGICPDLNSLVGIPSFTGYSAFSSSTEIGATEVMQISMCPQFTGEAAQAHEDNWGCYIAKAFRFVRYDTRLIFHFKLTPLTSMRIRISVNYGTTSSTSYDIPSQVHLIKGSVDIPIDIPFLNINQVITPSTALGRVTVELLAPPIKVAASDIIAPFWTSISYHNAEFYSPQDFLSATPPALMEEQGYLRAQHMDTPNTAWIKPNRKVPHMTQVKSLETLLRRFSVDTQYLLDPQITYPDDREWFYSAPMYHKYAVPFEYYTGSKEIKLKSTATGAFVPEFFGIELLHADPTHEAYANGRVQTEASLWPIVDALIPFISNLSYLSMTQTNARAKTYGTKPIGWVPVDNKAVLLSRAGPDFSVGYPNVLPPSTFWGHPGS